jgi:hypothetical protein
MSTTLGINGLILRARGYIFRCEIGRKAFMNTRRAFLALAVLGWSVLLAWAGDELSRVWSGPKISVRQRAEAVNRAFTNGTPVSVIVAALGTNYTRCMSSARVWMGPGPEPPNTLWLSYRFGEEDVTINTTATISENPLNAKFTGAGYSFQRKHSTETTNKIGIGQQGAAANGSQPIRVETNSTPVAAGSRR